MIVTEKRKIKKKKTESNKYIKYVYNIIYIYI
jgi:hypothetical protein